MGTFTVKVNVRNPDDPTRIAEVECWVDTGALYSQLPRSFLSSLGIAPTGTRRVLLADGREEDVNLAEARFEVDGRDVTSIVIFGNETAPALLGAVALESLGLGVDPGSKRLVPIVAPMFFISLSFSLCTSPKPAIPTREIRVFALSALGNPFESAMV